MGARSVRKEAQALAKFKHPAIVDVSDIFDGNGTAYMVLAYEPGPNLGKWLRDLGRPPTQEELDAIVLPLLDAVEHVHARKILHRDIAPDNILVRADGTPVLIDFGAARDDLQHRTARVTAVVKPGYSPPEQYQSDPASQGPWTDIYGFGATLYYAVAGALPSDQDDEFDTRVRTEIAQRARGSYRPKFLSAIDWALQPILRQSATEHSRVASALARCHAGDRPRRPNRKSKSMTRKRFRTSTLDHWGRRDADVGPCASPRSFGLAASWALPAGPPRRVRCRSRSPCRRTRLLLATT